MSDITPLFESSVWKEHETSAELYFQAQESEVHTANVLLLAKAAAEVISICFLILTTQSLLSLPLFEEKAVTSDARASHTHYASQTNMEVAYAA